MTKSGALRFGIQSFDRLIGTINKEAGIFGIDVSEPEKSEEAESQLPITSSICLAGPDGTGKSVISLHLASQYLADCLDDGIEGSTCPNLKILYISTDLTYNMALKGWHHFSLNQPFKRREPLVELREGRIPRNGPQFEIGLKQYYPSGGGSKGKSITNYLERYSYTGDACLNPQVCFVDLASRTAGDDWGFVHRLLSSLEVPEKEAPRHLVILDAVEGFETLVGDLNAFGEESSRRSRIAQVMRLAAGRCHLLLVVEESLQQRFPEEFVTDVVIRLRNVNTGRYVRRTVEIEKARSQWHRRGQHPYVIRNGVGSTTGEQQNPDDPELLRQPDPKKHQGYVHVFPSLDYLSREVMIDRDPVRIPDKTRFAAFGLPYLDNMLGGKGERAERDPNDHCDTRGLTCSSATALIGDSLTQKSQLGKAFLSRAFFELAEDLRQAISQEIGGPAGTHLVNQVEDGIRDIAHKKTTASVVTNGIIEKIMEQVRPLADRLYNDPEVMHPVAVLFTTQDLTVNSLAAEFSQRLRNDDVFAMGRTEPAVKNPIQVVESNIQNFANYYEELLITRKELNKKRNKKELNKGRHYLIPQKILQRQLVEIAVERIMPKYIEAGTICRRFEIHDLPGPVLMNIFRSGIARAQRIMFGGSADTALPKDGKRFQESWRIRVVIDDLNSLHNTFPEIREDPLMLPSLLFMLGREGVTSLLIDTQTSGSPELSITERFDSSVRELVQTRIYIWRLPFFGENRVALSVIPPMSHEYRGLIRELRWETKTENVTDRSLSVDPHFELYSGLERAQPQPVPLEVRLFSDSPSVARYIAAEDKLLGEIFTPVRKNNGESGVIVPAQLNEYELLRDACHVQRDTRLDHTTIVQVNEFWWLRRPRQRRAGAFRPQWNYLSSATATLRGDKYYSEPAVDPFWVFQPTPSEEKAATKTLPAVDPERAVKQKLHFYDPDCEYGYEKLGEDEKQYVDRVPYTWDFGFLLCNGRAWAEAITWEKTKDEGSTEPKPGSVTDVWNRLRKVGDQSVRASASWREFLSASKAVAEFQSYRTSTNVAAFDFTMLLPESFSCLILEMWLSESLRTLRKYLIRDERSKEIKRKIRRLEGVSKRRWSPTMESPVTLLVGLRGEREETLESILHSRRTNKAIAGYTLELYKVWLLLTEAVSFADLVDSSSHLNFEFKCRDMLPNAVSARHWYKTASSFMDSLTQEQVEHNWIPVRLPGHFSVRGDWFLAVTGGSRSSRLADHALDLLSSQRANITRLQEGIGLPTRRLFSDSSERSHLRTRLISAERGKVLKNIEYDDLRRIGAQGNDSDFFWLWRSGIGAYNRHSRIWQKWLNRTLLWWHSWHQLHNSNWTNGFVAYDLVDDIEFSPDPKVRDDSKKKFDELGLDSWNAFGKLRDILISELEHVSIATL
jgi:KaiC/GvpD/RAD55 family RecA-like ATPase